MNKQECQQTKKTLPKYLRGHVFSTKRARIERHLKQCIICRSEFEALRRMEETRQILKDLHSYDGVIGRVQEGVSALGKVKKILYRPLWIAGIVLLAGAVYYYAMKPRQLDLEIEKIVKSGPATSPTASSASSTAVTAPSPTAAAVKRSDTEPAAEVRAAAPAGSAGSQSLPSPAPRTDPLVVTLSPENDTTAVRRINEVMHSHGQLRTLKFSETVREVAGSLTAGELSTFFDRIGPSVKVSYSRKRLESFPATLPIPFVLKLKAAPKPKPQPVAAPEPQTAKPEPKPAASGIPAAEATAPSSSSAQ